jgi:uncharacterized protein (DUF1697 family)
MSGARGTMHVGLLRSVNVGGRNRLPMEDLRAIVAAAGGADARTYVQSGNVVFRAPKPQAAKIARDVSAEVHRRFGFQSPVILRSAPEMTALLGANPFLEDGADPKTLHAALLESRPTKLAAAALDPDRSPGDSFQLVGRDLYLHLPAGVARTKLTTPYLEKTLGCACTIRNWRTVTALAEMCSR